MGEISNVVGFLITACFFWCNALAALLWRMNITNMPKGCKCLQSSRFQLTDGIRTIVQKLQFSIELSPVPSDGFGTEKMAFH